MSKINRIITEEINSLFSSIISEADNGKKKKKKTSHRTKHTGGGGTKSYDYDDYTRSNPIMPDDEADQIRDQIDTNIMDTRAVSKRIYRNHTKNGAQSQLRKVIKGERPMTYPVANKLNKMISQGQIPVKN